MSYTTPTILTSFNLFNAEDVYSVIFTNNTSDNFTNFSCIITCKDDNSITNITNQDIVILSDDILIDEYIASQSTATEIIMAYYNMQYYLIIPPTSNYFRNGNEYFTEVIFVADDASSYSAGVYDVKCYSNPAIKLETCEYTNGVINFEDEDITEITITKSYCVLHFSYTQEEDDRLKYYQFILYDINGNLLSNSQRTYLSELSYHIENYNNLSTYILKLYCVTQGGNIIERSFTININYDLSNIYTDISFDVSKVNAENNVSFNLREVTGTGENYTFGSYDGINGEYVITSNNGYVTFIDEYKSIDTNFLCRLWCFNLTDGASILTIEKTDGSEYIDVIFKGNRFYAYKYCCGKTMGYIGNFFATSEENLKGANIYLAVGHYNGRVELFASLTGDFTSATTYTITGRANNSQYGKVITDKNYYTYGETAVITAMPNEGYKFSYWAKDYMADNPRTETVKGNDTYIAEFEQIEYSVNIVLNGVAEGDNNILSCDVSDSSVNKTATNHSIKLANVVYGSTLTIICSYDTDTMEFDKCVNRNTGETVTANVVNGNILIEDITLNNATMGAGQEVNTFNVYLKKINIEDDTTLYTITATGYNYGTVTQSGSGKYKYAEEVTLTAVPNEGCVFTNWDDENTDNPRIVTVEGDATYIANFSPTLYELKIGVEGVVGGTLSVEKATDTSVLNSQYNENGVIEYYTTIGSELTLTVTPKEGYKFVKWNDENTENPRTVTITGQNGYYAIFEEVEVYYSVAVEANDDAYGTVTINGTDTEGSYSKGFITIQAIPKEDCEFIQWNDENTSAERLVYINSDRTYTAYFRSKLSYCTINLTSNDSSMGTATITPSNENNEYKIGETLTITAQANEGYIIKGVYENDEYSSLDYIDSLANDFTLDESYAGKTYNLQVVFVKKEDCIITIDSSDTMGTVTGAGTYKTGDMVTLTATPLDGYEFVNWSIMKGAVATIVSKDETYTFKATQTVEYTASFTEKRIYRDILVASSGNGTVEVYLDEDCTNQLTANDDGTYTVHDKAVYYIKATPDEHYELKNWTVINSSGEVKSYGTIHPFFITPTDMNITANFGLASYTIIADTSDETAGTVTGGGTYTYGTQVTLEAKPKAGYEFKEWNDGNTENPRTVTVADNDDDNSYTAYFSGQLYEIRIGSENTNKGTVTFKVADNNSTLLNGDDGTFYYTTMGSRLKLTATSKDGYEFDKWVYSPQGSDAIEYDTSDPTITVQTGGTCIAYFKEVKAYYSIIVKSNNETMGTVTGGGENIESGQKTLIVAVPNDGYKFIKWVGDKGDTIGNATKLITVNSNSSTTYTAYFEPIVYTLNVVLNGGVDSDNDGVDDYNNKVLLLISSTESNNFSNIVTTDHKVTCNATYGAKATLSCGFYGNKFSFVKWVNENTGEEFTTDVDITLNNDTVGTNTETITFTAYITPKTYTITAQPANTLFGSVTGGGNYEYGDTVTLTATDNQGYSFLQWNDGNKDNPRTITVSGDATYTAYFQLASYTITTDVSPTGGGTVTGGGTYTYGTQVTLEATPDTSNNYVFIQWSDGVYDAERTITVSDNATYTAYFAIKTYTIYTGVQGDSTQSSVSIECVSGFLSKLSTGCYVVQHGSKIKLTATPISGYEFVKWSDDNSTDNPREVTISASDNEKQFFAVFEEVQPVYFTAKISANGADSSDTYYISGDTSGTTNYGVQRQSNTIGETMYYYAKAGDNRVISKIDVSGSVLTADELVSNGTLNSDHTQLAYPTYVLSSLLDKTIEITVYFEAETTQENGLVVNTSVNDSSMGTATLTPNRSDNMYYVDDTYTLTAQPNSGYIISSMKIYYGDELILTQTNAGLIEVGMLDDMYDNLETTSTISSSMAEEESITYAFYFEPAPSGGSTTYEEDTIIDGVLYIGTNTTAIANSAYEENTEITSVIIPDSVTSIGINAFQNCSNLTSVTIGNNVTTIGGAAFYGCTSLTNITIPDSVMTISYQAFRLCSSLTSITIPSSVTSIGDSVFMQCFALADVYYSGTETQWNAITIESGNGFLTNATIHYNS